MTRDIIVFVKEKQITRKTFLKLNEINLEGYVFFFSVVLPLDFYLVLIIGSNLKL